MAEEALLADLLSRWQELEEQGQPISIAELCGNHPELAPELERRIGALRRMNALVAAEGPGPAVSSVVLTVEAGPPAERGKVFRLTGHATFLVGRDPGKAHFALPADPYFSRAHFLIETNPPLCQLQDLGSKNGTLVNGVKRAEVSLGDGDLIGCGKLELRVKLEGDGWTVGPPATLSLGATAGPPSIRTTAPGGLVAGPQLPLEAPLPRVPGYRIETELGRGGMGVVYRAVCEADGAAVALKTIQPAVAASGQKVIDRFLREIDVLRQLNHPGIVGFRASGEADGQLWFAMELVAGQDASRVFDAEGPLAIGRVVRWGLSLLEALAHAHELKFIHRDVKPGNLLVTTGATGAETVKLADFGLARAYQASALSGLTMTGSMGGTLGFMPPEQALDLRSAKPPADQYSTAATLYYLLTGHRVFGRCSSVAENIRKLLNDVPVPPGQLRRELPPGLSAALLRALSRAPEQRFPDVGAFAQALRPFA